MLLFLSSLAAPREKYPWLSPADRFPPSTQPFPSENSKRDYYVAFLLAISENIYPLIGAWYGGRAFADKCRGYFSPVAF
jgi:hypothetical protein